MRGTSRSNRVRLVESVKPRLHQRWGAQLALAIWRWPPELLVVAAVVVAYVLLIA